MGNYLSRIDERLSKFLANDKQATEHRLREAVRVLGATLIAFEEQYNHRLDQKLAKVPNDKNAEAKKERIKRQQHEIVQTVDDWLGAVDAQLQSMITSGKIVPSFLMASKLSSAINSTFDPDEKSSWSQWTDVTMTLAVGLVEELVPQANSIGEDDRWALRIIEEEFAALVQQYRKIHSIGAPG